MLPKSQRNDFFIVIFFFFISGLLACNYAEQGDRKSENLVRQEIADNSRMNEHDGSFLMQCGASNLKMMELARMGMSRVQNADLKEIAAEIEKGHQALYEEALQLAQHKNVSLPVVINESDKIELEKLAQEKTDNFDKRFSEVLMREHNYMLEAASRFSDDAHDTEIRAFARSFSGRISEIIHSVEVVNQKIVS